MQKQNPVIKNYIYYPQKKVLNYSSEFQINIMYFNNKNINVKTNVLNTLSYDSI